MTDVLVINALLDSLLKSISIMAGIKLVPGMAKVKNGNVSMGDVTGLMEMSGDDTKGSMALSFTKPFVIDLVKRIFGDEIDDINETAIDLTGELTNMVVGGAKNILSEKGLEIGMSTPHILTGENHVIDHTCDGKTVVIAFAADVGDVFLELNFVD
ncbi:MAG: chemotaxis protein CheX [Gammaproteobacteria bacterium]|nr:chemotaxis protein CheX [Gammaproteobacteria bacterium]